MYKSLESQDLEKDFRRTARNWKGNQAITNKICKNFCYIKKQNKTTITKKKTKRKGKEKKGRKRRVFPGIELETFCTQGLFVNTTPRETNCESLFPRTSSSAPCTKLIEPYETLTHLKNSCLLNYKPIGYKLVCEQNVFFTPIFARILKLIIQNRFHLLLKVLLHSKFNCKKHLPSPKTTAKKQCTLVIDMMGTRFQSNVA